MLFKAEITSETIKSENALIEQLYIFLNEYVHARLRNESRVEKEDCVQDTVMYLFKRYQQLDEELRDNINLEKFFYNRANSFVSGYVNKLRTRRNAVNKYIEQEFYLKQIEDVGHGEPEYADEELLEKIIKSYKLDEEKEKILKEFTEFRLKIMGYDVPEAKKRNLDSQTFNLLTTLSYAVIDEYMLKSTEDKVNV